MSSYRLTWRPFFGGHLALGHKPGKRLRSELEATDCTLVVSLLSSTESDATEGPDRARLRLEGARPPGVERDQEVRALFNRVTAELLRGGKVFVHCSAGLHRTGMIAYAYFRHRGLTAEKAKDAVHELRELTASEMTTERCVWGDRFANDGSGGAAT
jgi:hypothetical protein